MKQKILMLVLAFSTCTALAGDLYKWTDANGVVHFSDTPPPTDTRNAAKVRVSKGVTADADDISAVDAAKEAAKNPPPPPVAPAAPPPPPAMVDTPENRARVCEQARANIELLQSKFQVADPSGKPMDTATRQGMIEQAKQSAAGSCVGGA